MNNFRTLMILAMFATGASAVETRECAAMLSMVDVPAAMGAGVRAQPVFADGGIKGWRIYNTQKSGQLTAQGIEPGALMTHVCGVPAREIFVSDNSACCKVDASHEFEVTFRIAGQEKKVLIKRKN